MNHQNNKSKQPAGTPGRVMPLLKALAINVGVGTAFWLSLQIAFNASSHLSDATFMLIFGILSYLVYVIIYASYRLAYWSLATGHYKAKIWALLTPLMMFLQSFAGIIISSALLARFERALFFSPGDDPLSDYLPIGELEAVLSLLSIYVFIGALFYFFALRRATRKYEGFQAPDRATPHMPSKVRPIMCIYGIVSTFFGFGEIVHGIAAVFYHNSYIGLVSATAWIVYLFLFWNAYAQKVIGRRAMWRVLAPSVIVADIAGVIATAIGTNASAFSVVSSILFSLPLYATVIWYAYWFLPASRDREINHMKREDLFQ